MFRRKSSAAAAIAALNRSRPVIEVDPGGTIRAADGNFRTFSAPRPNAAPGSSIETSTTVQTVASATEERDAVRSVEDSVTSTASAIEDVNSGLHGIVAAVGTAAGFARQGPDRYRQVSAKAA